jgi:hypothetical protein
LRSFIRAPFCTPITIAPDPPQRPVVCGVDVAGNPPTDGYVWPYPG